MTDRSELLTWLSDRASEVVTDADDRNDVANRILAATSLTADAFALEALQLSRIVGESVTTVEQLQSLRLPQSMLEGDTRNALTMLIMVAQSVAIGRVSWPSRPVARKARAALADLGEAALAVASPLGPDLYGWLTTLLQVALRLLSDIAANAAPVVIVQTGVSLPATVLAYQLYGDAGRAGGVVDIARSATPMIMPTEFEAIAS